MFKRTKILYFLFCFVILAPQASPNASMLSHFWHNKKTTAALLLSGGLVAWDLKKLASGECQNQTWEQTALGSYKGLIGAGLFSVLSYSLYKKIKNYEAISQTVTVKKPENATFFVPFYRNGVLQGYHPKQVHLGRRVIKRINAIEQKGADCGYHAIFNAMCLKKNCLYALGDKKTFTNSLKQWKKQVGKIRNTSETSNISSGEIEAIIKKQVSSLRSGNDIKKNVSLIDNINDADTMVQEKCIDLHLCSNIRRFQERRTPQIVILNPSDGDVQANYRESWHWLAVRLEWLDRSTVQMTVVDSLGGQNDAILDRLYNLFVKHVSFEIGGD